MDYSLRDMLSNMMTELECLVNLQQDQARQEELASNIKMFFYDFVDSIEEK